jgi:hypothetical protein
MKEVKIAFKILKPGEHEPVGYQFMKCHIIFDVKDGGLMTQSPAGSWRAHDGSPSHCNIRQCRIPRIRPYHTNRCSIKQSGLTRSQYSECLLERPRITKKIWTILGPKFGAELQGRKAIIIRALYGLKSAGAAFSNHLATCMARLGYKSCLAGPDVWMLARTRADGTTFWEYVLIYVDDILCISDNPKELLEQFDKYFPMKPNSIGGPDIYLHAKLSGVRLPNQVKAWAMSPSKYIQETCKNA